MSASTPDGAVTRTRWAGRVCDKTPNVLCTLEIVGATAFITVLVTLALLLVALPPAKGQGTEEYVWVREFGTSDYDSANAVAVDSSGVYVAGRVLGAFVADAYDAFLRKYDTGGGVLWVRQIGTESFDYGNAVATDGSGVYVAGHTGGTYPSSSWIDSPGRTDPSRGWTGRTRTQRSSSSYTGHSRSAPRAKRGSDARVPTTSTRPLPRHRSKSIRARRTWYSDVTTTIRRQPRAAAIRATVSASPRVEYGSGRAQRTWKGRARPQKPRFASRAPSET